MITLPKLYKMSSTGKIQEWEISCTQTPSGASYTVVHGQLDGKLQSTTTEVNAGKNIGRANETTPWEQCQLEAKALWTKKQERKGYSTTIPTGKKFAPMLAKSYNKADSIDALKDGKHISFPCHLQPKLDGLRCCAFSEDSKTVLRSRQNKPFTVLTHIEERLNEFEKFHQDGVILDGELYVHEGDNFQKIVSAIKRDKPNDLTGTIQYHIYDAVLPYGYSDRLKWLEDNLPVCDVIQLVSTVDVESHEGMKLHYSNFVAEGYEGVMLRNGGGAYKVDGRSADLQKVKSFMEEEFTIIGAEQNKGKMANQCSFVCETEDGTEFTVKPKGDEALREQYWRDWQSGKIKHGDRLTVIFFQWTESENPVPRFPVGKAIRDYE